MGGSLLKLFFIKSHLQNTVRQGVMEEKNNRLVPFGQMFPHLGGCEKIS